MKKCRHETKNIPFDFVYGIQVFEYISELNAALEETKRVLRPGGRCFILSTDWNSAVWHSENKERIQKILTSRGNHIQTPDLPSVLEGRLRQAGLETLKQTPISFLNRSYNENSFSYWASRIIRSYVMKLPDISDKEAEAWFNELDLLEQQNAYFFLTSVLTSVLTEAVNTGQSLIIISWDRITLFFYL